VREVQALAKCVILVMFVLLDLSNKYNVRQVHLVFHNQVCVQPAQQATSVQYRHNNPPNVKLVSTVHKVKVNAHNVQQVIIVLQCHHYRLLAKVAIILRMGQVFVLFAKLDIIVQLKQQCKLFARLDLTHH
jgi:hypothetical protein